MGRSMGVTRAKADAVNISRIEFAFTVIFPVTAISISLTCYSVCSARGCLLQNPTLLGADSGKPSPPTDCTDKRA